MGGAQTAASNVINAAEALKILGYPAQPGSAPSPPSVKPAAAVKPWYDQPIEGGMNFAFSLLAMVLTLLLLLALTKKSWFNRKRVGWNRLLVALSLLWVVIVGGALALSGLLQIKIFASVVYVPFIFLWMIYALTAWVVSGFKKGHS